MSIVYTIGHGVKTSEVLIQQLQQAGVQTLWDVRSKPYSRYNPQHNRRELQRALESVGIAYRWMGDRLGGLDDNHGIEQALTELARTANTAVMCSENSPTKCHRRTWITPELVRRGCVVVDLPTTHVPKRVDDPQDQLF